jgi:hypothetical protein
MVFEACATPPETPYGGKNRNAEQYPPYLQKYHNDKFAATGYDFSFLPRITNGKSGYGYEETAYQSTEQELLDYIAGLSNKNMRWKVVAEFPSYGEAKGEASVSEGTFKLPVMVFSDPPCFEAEDLKALKKPVIWIQGQIHGGESSGGDAMQVLAKRLAEGDLNYLLKKISVVIIPRYNVDGAWRNQRGTNSYKYRVGIDQNRDNQGFESPITRTMHRLVNRYEPFFFGDAHEMWFTEGKGYVNGKDTKLTIDFSGYDIATLIAPIYNHAPELKRYINDVFEPAYHGNIISKGMRWAWYTQTSTTPPGETPGTVIGTRGMVPADVRAKDADNNIILVTSADGGQKYVPLTTFDGAIDTGITDPSFGLKGACSILTESTTPSIGQNLGLRIAGHVTIYESVLKTAYEHADEFYKTVLEARANMAARGKKVADDNKLVLTIHYPKETVDHNLPVLTAKLDKNNNWYVEENDLPTKMYLSRNGTPNASVVQPGAYIIKAGDEVIARLAHSGVKFERLNADTEIEVEAYKVEAAAAKDGDTRLVPSGMTRWTDAKVITKVSKSVKTVKFPKGTFVMYMDQVRATHAAYALEPLSLRNYGNYYLCMKHDMAAMGTTPDAQGFFKAEVGEEYPVYRYMSTKKLDTYSIGELTAPFTVKGGMVEWVKPYTAEEKTAAEADIKKPVLCMSKCELWLKGGDEGVSLTMPQAAGDVSLKKAAWYAYDNSAEKYVKLTEENGEYKIPKNCIKDNCLTLAAASPAQGGSSGGCNTAGGAAALFVAAGAFLLSVKRNGKQGKREA